ncbi:hypothetical protein KZ829_20295 [Actinoplanes hulinensis]|uniref:DUF3757 domain-containing protein n=1 Tax=Actinoplanes hulinensis TaxID=1144547 RepID=A0ABS7B5A0_9ACTN|nr:hypothetical protein [Actinoplanes hulinensis]MBW6436087.1 hypothetical protein [Actinoplanes hulinensis]
MRKHVRWSASRWLTSAIMVLVTTAAGLVLTSSPASASVYHSTLQLCTPGDDRVVIPMGKIWSFSPVHATSDFTVDANDYSFRTCSWTGTNHTYEYKCGREDANGWTINLVARWSGSEHDRVVHQVVCDRQVHRISWNRTHRSSAAVHFHLWAPSGSGCDSSCNSYLYEWWAKVS